MRREGGGERLRARVRARLRLRLRAKVMVKRTYGKDLMVRTLGLW